MATPISSASSIDGGARFRQVRGRGRLAAFALPLTALLLAQPLLAAGPVKPVATELPDAPEPPAQGLHIMILEGEGALNNIRQRTAREPIVQVEDKNHKPVAGATVLFAINGSPNGAGATISGATSFSVHTNEQGIATTRNFAPNTTAGNFTITVTATYGAYTAMAIINQINFIPGVTKLDRLRKASQHTSSSSTSVDASEAGDTSAATSGGTTTAGVSFGPRLLHQITANPLKFGLAAGGVAAVGVVVGVLVVRSNPGTSVTAGTGTVTGP